MEKLLYTRKETAAMLNISVDTLDVLRRTGKIKAVHIGSRVYFTAEAIEALIQKEVV